MKSNLLVHLLHMLSLASLSINAFQPTLLLSTPSKTSPILPLGSSVLSSPVSSSPTISLRTSKTWEKRFEELVFYHQEHGDCNVPRNSGPLGNWVQKQRLSYKMYLLSEDGNFNSKTTITRSTYSSPPGPLCKQQVELLDSIGFIWDVHEYKYQCNLDDLREFYIRHSHYDVPSSLDGEYRTLYKWLCRQKDEYRKYLCGKEHKFTNNRREALERMGFHIGMFDVSSSSNQEPKRFSWKERYNQLIQFREENGHCNVPTNSKKYNQLSSWVQHQRAEKKKKMNNKHSRLSDEKETMLEKIGFIWSSKEWKWQMRLKDLKKYNEIHGNCNVPTKDGELGAWVMTQRLQYGKNKLPQKRVDALNDLGFVWNMHQVAWDEKFNELRAHMEEGECTTLSLNAWVASQRAEKRYKGRGLQNHLTDEREKKLDDLGFDWNVNEYRERNRQITWNRNFKRLKAHVEKMGSSNLRIKSKGSSFAVWVRDQKRYLKSFEQGEASPMTQGRRDLLVSIGL